MNESKEYLESLLRNYGLNQKGFHWQCINPDHADENPSANIIGKDGKHRLYCHVCAKSWDRFDILDIVRGKAKGASFKEEAVKSLRNR